MFYNTYPNIEPYQSGYLAVSDLHKVYFEQVGNPKGQPILFLHGGPGGGVAPKHRCFFDPQHYRIILFDQRGCGQSSPHAELRENTTWDLVSDIEKLRQHLNIKNWIVFGGSWGSTLALIYAETHPESVRGLILRGIFMCRQKEIDWFYQEGASKIFPDAWEHYLAPIPEEERYNLLDAYYRRLTGMDRQEQLRCAQTWSVWEASTSRLQTDMELMQSHGEVEFALAFARIECHYFKNKIFLKDENQILNDIYKIRHLPCEIVHGRYDMVCPLENAWELKRVWPEATLHIMPMAGHSASEGGITAKLVEITERFKSLCPAPF